MSSLSPTTSILETEPTLKVGLQSVLRSLDVGLEDELTRYRRKKREQQPEVRKASQTSAQVSSKVEAARAAIAQLTATPGLDHKATASTVEQPVTAPVESPTSDMTSPVAVVGAVPLESSLVSVSAEANDETAPASEPAEGQTEASAEDYFASSAALLETLTSDAVDDEAEEAPVKVPSRISRLMTPAGMGASMLLLVGSATAGYLVLHPESISHLQLAELLPARQAANSTVAQSAAPKLVNPELPPGAPDLSQKEFVDLTLSNLGSLNLNEVGETESALTVSTLPTVATAPAGLPLAPTSNALGSPVAGGGGANLAAGVATAPAPQSKGLLSNLANAVAGPAPALQMAPETPLPNVIQPPAAPLPIAPTLPAAPAVEYQPPAPAVQEPVSYEAAPEVEPDVAPAAAEIDMPETVQEVAIAPELAPLPEVASSYGTFIVVTPYISDLALSQVQQVVPDAFVENADGRAFIQAGIFDDAATAQSLVDQLQREGVNATVESY